MLAARAILSVERNFLSTHGCCGAPDEVLDDSWERRFWFMLFLHLANAVYAEILRYAQDDNLKFRVTILNTG